MSHVDLDEVDAGAVRTARGIHIGGNQPIHVGLINGARRVASVGGRIGAWTDHLDSGLEGHRRKAVPRCRGRGFATGMLKLDANRPAARVDRLGQCLEGFSLLVVPEAEIGIGRTAFGTDGGGLDHDKARPADGETSQMRAMPGGGQGVGRRIGLHRRDDDAVFQPKAAQLERPEQR